MSAEYESGSHFLISIDEDADVHSRISNELLEFVPPKGGKRVDGSDIAPQQKRRGSRVLRSVKWQN